MDERVDVNDLVDYIYHNTNQSHDSPISEWRFRYKPCLEPVKELITKDDSTPGINIHLIIGVARHYMVDKINTLVYDYCKIFPTGITDLITDYTIESTNDAPIYLMPCLDFMENSFFKKFTSETPFCFDVTMLKKQSDSRIVGWMYKK